MLIDVRWFFEQRNLPDKFFYYEIEDGTEGFSSDLVIDSIDATNKEVARTLLMFNKLNVTNDFLLNVYLQSLADDQIEDHIRLNKRRAIERKILKGEHISFTLKNRNGAHAEYSIQKNDDSIISIKSAINEEQFENFKNFSECSNRLEAMFDQAVFDNYKRIDESENVTEIGNEKYQEGITIDEKNRKEDVIRYRLDEIKPMQLIVTFKDGTKLNQFIEEYDRFFVKGDLYDYLRNQIKNTDLIETTDHLTDEIIKMRWSDVYSLKLIVGK
jgi:hypothetical protein